jgi:HK97 gp10 family phage protein
MNKSQYMKLKAANNRNSGGPARLSVMINVEGIEELEKRLEMIPEKLRKSTMRRAMNGAAKILLDEMKRNVPHESGALHKALTYVVRSKLVGGTKGRRGKAVGYPYAILGPDGEYYEAHRYKGRWKGQVVTQRARPALYEHLVDAGARPHQILKRGGKVMKKDILHPGAKPTNYRRRSVDSVKHKVMSFIFDTVDKAIFRQMEHAERVVRVEKRLKEHFGGVG